MKKSICNKTIRKIFQTVLNPSSSSYVFYIVGECSSSAAGTHLATNLTSKELKPSGRNCSFYNKYAKFLRMRKNFPGSNATALLEFLGLWQTYLQQKHKNKAVLIISEIGFLLSRWFSQWIPGYLPRRSSLWRRSDIVLISMIEWWTDSRAPIPDNCRGAHVIFSAWCKFLRKNYHFTA